MGLQKRRVSSGTTVFTGVVMSVIDPMRVTQPGLSHRHQVSATISPARFHHVPCDQTPQMSIVPGSASAVAALSAVNWMAQLSTMQQQLVRAPATVTPTSTLILT